MSTTANMLLTVPESGDNDYPASISSSMSLIDAHDHTSGKGVQIPAGGIASNAVTTAKILDSNVTTAKIAANAVTRAKLEAVGQQVSANVAYSASATSYTDVTNATVTITTTGRPVIIAMIPDSTGVGSISVDNTAASNYALDFKVLRDASTAYETTIGALLQLSTATPVGTPVSYIPLSHVNFLEVPAAGTYVYKLQARKSSGSANSSGNYAIVGRLVAYEL